MNHFEEGDVVQVINWSDVWDGGVYRVTGSYTKHGKRYYRIQRLGKLEVDGNEGAFTERYLKYAGPRAQAKEPDLLKLTVPELADLITKATARIVELTKDA